MTADRTVDVVIPVYNRVKLISRAIASVLGQTHADLRLIIVDDGSTDGTIEIVRQFSDDRVLLIEQAHGGVSRARNTGAAAGTSRHLIFLDSDDEADPRWLETLLDNSDEAAIVSCAARVIRPGEPERRLAAGRLGPDFHHISGHFLPGCFLVRRDVFERAGGYASQLSFGENTELALRLADATVELGLTTTTIDDPLLIIHQQAGGVSQAAAPEKLYSSSTYLLDHHYARISLNRDHLASCHAVAGVNAVRLGRNREARHHLRAAVRIRPRAWRYWVRLAQAMVPSPKSGSSRFRTVPELPTSARRSTPIGDGGTDSDRGAPS